MNCGEGRKTQGAPFGSQGVAAETVETKRVFGALPNLAALGALWTHHQFSMIHAPRREEFSQIDRATLSISIGGAVPREKAVMAMDVRARLAEACNV